MTTTTTTDCYNCELETRADLPPRDVVLRTDHWRVAHAFNVIRPGWLVVVPRVHVTSFAELTAPAADELGGIVRDLSRALERVTGCVKTYVMQFSEAEGWAHLHVHLLARTSDHPAHAIGPAAFALMSDDESQWLPEHERDELALRLREVLPGPFDSRGHRRSGVPC